jgi:hypothetical protein
MLLCSFNQKAAVKKETIWKLWTNVPQWPEWDHDIEWAQLDGEFKLGQTGTLKPKNGGPVKFKTVECTPFKSFSDESKLFLATLRFDHHMEEVAGGLKISVQVSVSGPLAFFYFLVLKKEFSKGFQEQIVSLIEMAKRREDQKI